MTDFACRQPRLILLRFFIYGANHGRLIRQCGNTEVAVVPSIFLVFNDLLHSYGLPQTEEFAQR